MSESTFVKTPHFWKSHAMAHIRLFSIRILISAVLIIGLQYIGSSCEPQKFRDSN